ncbi:hypothetical protein GGX14DRAFT_366818 [Mycena pura]|uniref:DUF6699 domain-containing protein n=1 Tax=Mycena pura TaxID=153505 RepID=A0AAD6VAW9_9AGAR|nr:hypothetical protein GGX14DRAFT_366818 [Mycena pura]
MFRAHDAPLGLYTSSTADSDNAAAQPRQARVQPIPLPAQVTGVTAVTLHPALRMGAKSLHTLDFAMPLPVDPKAVRAYGEPATFPALPSLTMTSPRLPWAMTAHASANASRACVTVGDVVRAIYGALGICVTEGEVEEWMVDHAREGPGSFVVDAFKTRRTGEKRKRAYERGMTRLALLEGRTKFLGLSESAMGCDVCVVDFV